MCSVLGRDWEACGCAETLLGGSAKAGVSISAIDQLLMNIREDRTYLIAPGTGESTEAWAKWRLRFLGES